MNKPVIHVYSGLTLDKADIRRILPNALISGPVKKDDLLNDIRRKIHASVLIDGVFHHSPAVSCGEIMDALRAGIRIYGSSSMGALRASELDRYGMIGHGKIYEHIKRDPYFRDDYLGQTFFEETGSIRRLSIPYIDLHFNLVQLLADRFITKEEFNFICNYYKGLHYSERHYGALKEFVENHHRSNHRLLNAVQRASRSMGSQKKRDAIGLLKRVKNDLQRIAALNQKLR